MKTWTFHNGTLYRGMSLERDEENRRIIKLGDPNSPDRSCWVLVNAELPPEIGNHCVCWEGILRKIKSENQAEGHRWEIVRSQHPGLGDESPEDNPLHHLVRVHTMSPSGRHVSGGEWGPFEDAPMPDVLVVGQGRCDSQVLWWDGIVKMVPGSVLRVTEAGGKSWLLCSNKRTGNVYVVPAPQ